MMCVISAPDPRGASVRALRAGVLTVPAVGLAGAAHALAAGCLDVTGLVLATGLCWSAAVWVLGAQRRLPALIAWLAAAQVVSHVLLEATCGPHPHALPAVVLAAHLAAGTVSAVLLCRADSGLWVAHALRRSAGRLRLPRLVLPALPTGPVVVLPRQVWLPVPRTAPVTPYVLRGPPSSAAA